MQNCNKVRRQVGIQPEKYFTEGQRARSIGRSLFNSFMLV